MTKVAEFRTLLRERLDGFELNTGIIDVEQIGSSVENEFLYLL